MLSRCANSACGAPFRYLKEGTVYMAEWANEGDACDLTRVPGPMARSRGRREMFWLCSGCSRKLTLMVDGNHVVTRARDEVPENDGRLLRPLKIAV